MLCSPPFVAPRRRTQNPHETMKPTALISSVVFSLFVTTAFAQEATTPPAQKHLLRISASVGTEQHLVQASEMTTTVEQPQGKVEMLQSTSLWIDAKVVAVEGGKTTLRHTYGRLKAKMTGMANVDYDSNDPESRPGPLSRLADIVGETATVVLSERGAVLSMDAPEVLEGGASGIDMKQMMMQAVPEMPDEPVAIGATWLSETNAPVGRFGDMKCKITNKLVSVEKGIARLDQKMEFATDALNLPGGMTIEVRDATAYTMVDLSSGMTADSETSMSMVMSMPQGMKMNMAMKTTMKRVDPAAEAAAKKDAKQGEAEKKPAEAGK